MEDLRKVKEDISASMGSIPPMDMPMPNTVGGKISTSYTNHLPRFVVSKKIKSVLFYFIIGVGISSICIYPYEIGNTIGYWIYNFWTGLTHRF
jgi:hypothetical protein